MKETILITGAGSGLGKLLTIHFAQQGWNVVATMRFSEKGKEFAQWPNILVTRLDVSQPDTVRSSLDDAIGRFGSLTVVVNNAGYGLYGPLELLTDDDIDKQIDVNFKGVINVTRAALPIFRKQRKGKFINISSVVGRSAALPLISLYSATKFALEGLTESLYNELKPFNIDVHLIEPGGFDSSFEQHMIFRTNKEIHDYDPMINSVKNVLGRRLPSPQPIVDGVYKIACGKSNVFRTVIGKDAKMLLLLRKLLPVKTVFKLLASQFLK